MPRICFWYAHVGPHLEDEVTRSLKSLEDASLVVRPWAGAEVVGSDPFIVFFEDVTDGVTKHVRSLCNGGAARVLAVQLSGGTDAIRRWWQLLDAGATDVLALGDGAATPVDIALRLKRWHAIDEVLRSPLIVNNLVGTSPAWVAALREVIEIALFTNASVLLSGESGTGKELIARLIHALDTRPQKRDLVIVDCTTIVPELAGSEFFGHERGAFTGAVAGRDGAFVRADRGTLFLDEIGELPLALQSKLLRAVQEGTVKRVGGNEWKRTDFRLICATHRDLAGDIASGRFRADLYYRIASVTCRIPPLRDRPEDILPLFRHFLAEHFDGAAPEIDDPVRALVAARPFPGNVRELRQLAARIAYRHVGAGPITIGEIPGDERQQSSDQEGDWCGAAFQSCIRRALARGCGLQEIKSVTSETAVRLAVSSTNGNLREAAKRLGVTDRSLQMRRATWRRRQQAE